MKGVLRFVLGAALALVTLLAPMRELRAEPTNDKSGAASDGGEDIVVTARRRNELLSRVAVPVSVATGAELRDSFAEKVENLDAVFPELTVQPTGTGNLIFLRGVGNFTLQPNSDPAVGFDYDGVLVARPGGSMGELFDLDRVELMKGPQGVLYGRNASVGAIHVEPRQPVLGLSEAHADLTFGSYSQARRTGTVNVPLGDRAALRFATAFATGGAYLTGYRHGEEQGAVRIQVTIEPRAGISIRLAGDYSHLGGVGAGTSYVGNYIYSSADGDYDFRPSGISSSQGLYSKEAQAYREGVFLPIAGRKLDPLAATPWQNNEIYGVQLHAEADLGFAKLTVLPAWRGVMLDLTNAGSPFGYDIREQEEQASLETRLAARSGPLEWLAGTLLFKEDIDSRTATNLSSSLILSDQTYDTGSVALFANVLLHLSSSIRASAGMRWTRDAKSFDGHSDTLGLACVQRQAGIPSCPLLPLLPLANDFADQPLPVPLPGTRVPILVAGANTGAIATHSIVAGNGYLSAASIDWRIGGEADLGPHDLLYAMAETGHRPGGFNIATGFETYGPERLAGVTLGLRHHAAGDRVQLHSEAFWWTYSGQQVSSLRPDQSSPPRNANITDNIGNSRIRGVEVEGRVSPSRALRLRSAIQYLDAKYRSFTYAQANTGVPPLTGCVATLQPPTNLYVVDCSMKQPYNSPRWTLSLSARRSFQLGRLRAAAELDTHFRSSRNIGFAFLPEQHVGATTATNLNATLAPAQGKWEITVMIENIEGNRIPEFAIYHPVSNILVAGTTAPRRIALRFALRD